MRPVAVVMADENAEDALEMALVDDQEPVEAFGAGGADEALGERVCLWRSHWRLDDLDSFAGEDGVEVAGELAVPVADEGAKRRSPLLEYPGELSGLLGDPGARGVLGTAGQVDTSAPLGTGTGTLCGGFSGYSIINNNFSNNNPSAVLLITPTNVEVSADEKRRLQERGLYQQQ